MPTTPTAGQRRTVAVLGLGEAGGAIAAALAARGEVVQGYDPAPRESPEGVRRSDSPHAAVRDAEAIMVLVGATAAEGVAESVAPALEPGVVYADCCSAAPAVKRSVADVVQQAGAAFADVALLAPVPGRGLALPALVSGEGAERFAKLFDPLGLRNEVVSTAPGDAAARKLLRSVFMKGFAAAILEALEGAEALGCGEWLRANVAAELEGADAELAERLITGTRLHADRRVGEMAATERLLAELDVDSAVTRATRSRLERLARTNDRDGPR